MSEPLEEPPWIAALSRATLAFGRGNRVMLEIDTRTRFINLLKDGWEAAKAQGCDAEYEAAAATLIAKLSDELTQRGYSPEGQLSRITEFELRTQGRPQASIEVLPERQLVAALGTLCPGFWPFC